MKDKEIKDTEIIEDVKVTEAIEKDIETEIKSELGLFTAEEEAQADKMYKDVEITEEFIEEEINTALGIISIDEAIADKSKITIKNYISFQFKQILVEDVINSCVINDDGITKIDYGLKLFVTEYLMVLQYANIDLPETNFVDTYDLLNANGIIEYVLNEMPSNEIYNLKLVINQEVEQALILSNKFEVIVNKFLQDLLTKIPETKSIEKWIKNLIKSLKDFNPEKVAKLQELLTFSKTKGEDVDGESGKTK